MAPGPLEVVRRGSTAFKDLASDYRRLNAMVVASRADALAKAAATPLNLQQLWLTGLPAARPGDTPPGRTPRRAAPGGAGASGPVGRPAAGGASGRDPAGHRSRSRTVERELARVVVPAPRRRPRRPRGPVDRPGSLTQTLDAVGAWGLSARRVPDPSVVLRVADAVVTDGADDAVDFLLTGRPLLVLDPERPETDEAAGHYPAAAVLPGPVCRTFDELEAALEAVFDPLEPAAGRGLRAGGRPRVRAHRRPVGLAAGRSASAAYVDALRVRRPPPATRGSAGRSPAPGARRGRRCARRGRRAGGRARRRARRSGRASAASSRPSQAARSSVHVAADRRPGARRARS